MIESVSCLAYYTHSGSQMVDGRVEHCGPEAGFFLCGINGVGNFAPLDTIIDILTVVSGFVVFLGE